MAPAYTTDPLWADVVPIAQNDGGPNSLATIAYSEEYSTAMSYLRALMAVNEHSDRALAITEHIIQLNAAHYTVWLYRAAILKALGIPPLRELQWLNEVALANEKNYQIWHHRETVMRGVTELPDFERPFLARMLAKDSKNYHVWSYRQWLVGHFGLWPQVEGDAPTASSTSKICGKESEETAASIHDEEELRFVEQMIDQDVLNNSAWNHRFYVLFGRSNEVKPASWGFDREIDYACSKIAAVPQNASSWNYLRGILQSRAALASSQKNSSNLSTLESFAQRFVALDGPLSANKSTQAMELLADIWAEQGRIEEARKAYTVLAQALDPIRRGYWAYCMQQLQPAASSTPVLSGAS